MVNYKKLSLETSVVLQLLVGVPTDQEEIANAFVSKRTSEGDSLHVSESHLQGHMLVTFEKAGKKLPGAQVLQVSI